MSVVRPAIALLKGRYAVCRLDPDAAVPAWAQGGFVSITRTADELSVVCEEAGVPEGVRCERGWRCLTLEGPLDFALVGVLHSLLAPLSYAGVSVFAVSTYDTDYVLVRDADLHRARAALKAAGWEDGTSPVDGMRFQRIVRKPAAPHVRPTSNGHLCLRLYSRIPSLT